MILTPGIQRGLGEIENKAFVALLRLLRRLGIRGWLSDVQLAGRIGVELIPAAFNSAD